MNGHGGRRSGSGRKQLLSPEQQLHAVVLCETIKRRSSRSRTKRKLNEIIHERFPELKDNRAQFQAVPIEVRRRVFKKNKSKWTSIHGSVELAQEAHGENKRLLGEKRLFTMQVGPGFDRLWIMRMVARIMSRRSGRIIKPEYIRKIWNRWGRVVRSH